MKDVIFFGWADVYIYKKGENETALCVNDDSGVSFKKGYSCIASHVHVML
jgi:hypothetical protein